MRFVVRQFTRLSASEREACGRLTLPSNDQVSSEMQHMLSLTSPHYVAVLGYQAEALVGWASVRRILTVVRINVFVDPRHRRKGYGTRLFERAEQECQDRWPALAYGMVPHDDASRAFLNAIGLSS